MRRRAFIAGLGGVTMAWPVEALAQQADRGRRIGVMMDTAENNPEGQVRAAALRQTLQERGWADGRNLQIDYRWSGGNLERSRDYASDLVAQKPDVIFALANAQVRALAEKTRTIPIVFVGASEPVEAGYAASFARPGGNLTGFTLFESSLGGKWLEILREVAPTLSRVVMMVNPDTGTLQGTFYVRAFETAAAAVAVKTDTMIVRNANDIEAAISALGQKANSGLIVAPDGFTQANDELIVALATRHRVPAIYGPRNFAKLGGLVTYGPDLVDACRRAAVYIDRILRGEMPADLPIQAPIKYELLINLKTAKALGLDVPISLQQRSDEVIE
jgi:putative ABC transport system substrate-binding protein